jgi:hypothetical protein
VSSDAREKPPALPAPWTWRTTGMALVWSAVVFASYLADGREIWSGDSVPAKYLTCALVRGDGFYLDRYRREVLKWWPYAGMPYYVSMVDGHYVSRYPIGPVFVALPFTMPQVVFLDWAHSGWETSDPQWFDTIAQRSAAAITTLTALALLAVLRKLGLGREAWLAALISTFSCWWAGLCFGPRYWTKVVPLLAIVLGMALAWARVRCRPIFAVSLVLIVVSIGVQFLGAAAYPSGWEDHAQEDDRFTQRLWDWSDSELSRCIVVSEAYRALFGPAEAKVAGPGIEQQRQ